MANIPNHGLCFVYHLDTENAYRRSSESVFNIYVLSTYVLCPRVLGNQSQYLKWLQVLWANKTELKESQLPANIWSSKWNYDINQRKTSDSVFESCRINLSEILSMEPFIPWFLMRTKTHKNKKWWIVAYSR